MARAKRSRERQRRTEKGKAHRGPRREFELMRMKCMTEGPRGALDRRMPGLDRLIGLNRRASVPVPTKVTR